MIRLEMCGRLTTDVKVMSAGQVVKIVLAVKENKDKVSFHELTAFGKNAINLAKYAKKGQMILVDNATIENNKYVNNDGKTVYTKDLIIKTFKFL